jgi:YhcH/YjgK/YiaL family protein
MLYSTTTDQLGLVFPQVAEFLAAHDLAALANGRHEVAGGTYVNVMTYETRAREDARYEAHRDYIDVQMVVNGRELCESADVARATLAVPYDEAGDAALYANDAAGDVVELRPGAWAAYYPGDAHMPSLQAAGAAEPVKKAVFKVPVA